MQACAYFITVLANCATARKSELLGASFAQNGSRLHQGETFRRRVSANPQNPSTARRRFVAAARAGFIGEWTAGPVASSAGTRELPGPQARTAVGGGCRKEQTNRQGDGATRRHVAVDRLRAPQRPYPQRGAQPRRPPSGARGQGFRGNPQRGVPHRRSSRSTGGKPAPALRGGAADKRVRSHFSLEKWQVQRGKAGVQPARTLGREQPYQCFTLRTRQE
jgi:hypothetical protein